MTKEQFLERCGWIADGVCLYNAGSRVQPNLMPCESIDRRGDASCYHRKSRPKRRPFTINEVRCGWTLDFGTKGRSKWLITNINTETGCGFCYGNNYYIEPNHKGWENWQYSPDFENTWLPWGVEEPV